MTQEQTREQLQYQFTRISEARESIAPKSGETYIPKSNPQREKVLGQLTGELNRISGLLLYTQ